MLVLIITVYGKYSFNQTRKIMFTHIITYLYIQTCQYTYSYKTFVRFTVEALNFEIIFIDTS